MRSRKGIVTSATKAALGLIFLFLAARLTCLLFFSLVSMSAIIVAIVTTIGAIIVALIHTSRKAASSGPRQAENKIKETIIISRPEAIPLESAKQEKPKRVTNLRKGLFRD